MISTSDMLTASLWSGMCQVWAILLWMQWRVRRDGTLLSPSDAPPQPAGERVCVLIPARNEQCGIAGCVGSVLMQDVAGLGVTVVDDRSSDGTRDAVRTLMQQDERLQLREIDHLPSGWMGKTHALSVAGEAIDSDWVLFLDADCRLLDPRALRSAIGEARRRGADLLTLLPSLETRTFGEALIIPLCSAVMALWFGLSNRPSRRGFANGQFLLVRREAYQSIGGHAAVRDALIEDVPLAEAFRSAGRVTWTGGGRAIVSVRMYDGFAATFRGWSRIFVGALRSPLKLFLSIAWLIAGSMLPFAAVAWLLGSAASATSVSPTWWLMFSLAAGHLLLLGLVSFYFWDLGRCDRRYLLVYPLSVFAVIAILAHAFYTLTLRRKVGWRETSYRLDRHARIVPSTGAPA